MGSLRIPMPEQLPLEGLTADPAAAVWATLPEPVREHIMVLLAGMIARGVVLDDEGTEDGR